MSFTNPFSTKTARVSTITAAEVNAAGQAISRAVDGVGGGTYALTAPLAFTDDTVTINELDGAMTGTERLKLGARSITRVQETLPTPLSATWVLDAWGRPVQSVNNFDGLVWPLHVPDGATLTAVSVGIDPAASHGGAPTMPEVAIFSISLAGETLISSTADPTDIADYENAHEFGPTGLSEEADRTARRFVAVITGEGGANYVAGLVVNYVKVTYTPASYDED